MSQFPTNDPQTIIDCQASWLKLGDDAPYLVGFQLDVANFRQSVLDAVAGRLPTAAESLYFAAVPDMVRVIGQRFLAVADEVDARNAGTWTD